MKCELIIDGLKGREQFWQYCWESDTCVNWHDGTIHAIYYSKQCAREEAKLLKSYYPNIKTHIGTDFDGWLYISNRILRNLR